MANWPDSPSWSDPKTINAGNQYNAADGVLYTDMNKIISNLLYLKQRGGIIPTGILSIISNDTYDVTKYARVEVNVPQTGGGDQPQLNAPTISIAGTTLSIEDPATNGNFTVGWKLYDNGAYVDQFLTAVIQLTDIQFSVGTHKLTVKSFGTNFKDSVASNEVTYQILYTYTITTALSHVIADSANPKTIKENASASLIFTAASGYELPETVTVTGCTYTWEPSTGVLGISNPTSNVAISISAIAVYQITTTLTGCAGASSNPSTIEQNGAATLTFTANTGYALPDTITVEGATHTWNKSTGTLTLSDPTGNATITIVAIDITPQLATPQNVTANGTTVSWDEVENATSYEIYADGVSIGTVEKAPVQHGYAVTITKNITMTRESEAYYSLDNGVTYIEIPCTYDDLVLNGVTQIKFKTTYYETSVYNGSTKICGYSGTVGDYGPYYSENIILSGDATFTVEWSD